MHSIVQHLTSNCLQVGNRCLVYPITGLIVTLFALLAVGIQTYRAANTNPAHSLKYE